jgi:hypothetical protein
VSVSWLLTAELRLPIFITISRCCPIIGRSFGVAADVIALLPMLTQIGYALRLFLFVPLGDVVDRRQLVSALLFGTGSSLAVLALGVVLLDVGIQAAMNGNQSTVLSLAPQATSRTNTILRAASPPGCRRQRRD